MDKVSIIIPVFNKIKYLKKTLNSIKNQSYENLQVILIDDGSSDGSIEVINEYILEDDRFIFKKQDHAGVAVARNKGLSLADGDYAVFIDADDEIKTDYIATLVNNCRNCDLVVSGLIERDYESKKIINIHKLKNETFTTSEDTKIFNKKNYSILSLPVCKLFKLHIIKHYKLSFPLQDFGEDSIFVLNYLGKIKNIRMINYNGYMNNIIPNTLSRKYVEDIDYQLLAILQSLKENFPQTSKQSWNFMLCRSMKLSLANELKQSKSSFVKECKNLMLNSIFQNIRPSKNFNLNNNIIIFLLKIRMFTFLYYIFKMANCKK